MEVDFLLIGQGLAGTVLSYRLIKAGFKVHLIDKDEEGTSSKVAAGLYNPITGRRMVKTWQADVLFPEIEPFYKEMESFLGKRFFFPVGIYRPFLSFEEQNEWLAKSADDRFEEYVGKIYTAPRYPELHDGYGGLLLKKSGYLDIYSLMKHYQSWLKKEKLITLGTESECGLTQKSGCWAFNGGRAKALVFANGLGAGKNRYFNWLPFAPVKGEILTVKQPFETNEIINRGIFRINLSNGTARVGSTYDRIDLTLDPTEKAKNELLEKLDELMNAGSVSVIDHQVGIRPATVDRRPFLGKHPEFENVYLFGGFGAKGVSLAPYYSREMVKLLTLNEEPQKEVNIIRFFKYI
ncbi:MAG: FAD-dependent oxidoreductase [Cyclobacteriaceae bacterium]